MIDPVRAGTGHGRAGVKIEADGRERVERGDKGDRLKLDRFYVVGVVDGIGMRQRSIWRTTGAWSA